MLLAPPPVAQTHQRTSRPCLGAVQQPLSEAVVDSSQGVHEWSMDARQDTPRQERTPPCLVLVQLCPRCTVSNCSWQELPDRGGMQLQLPPQPLQAGRTSAAGGRPAA